MAKNDRNKKKIVNKLDDVIHRTKDKVLTGNMVFVRYRRVVLTSNEVERGNAIFCEAFAFLLPMLWYTFYIILRSTRPHRQIQQY